MTQLSKTAKASMRVGVTTSRTPVAWIFQSKPGKMQTRPFYTSYEKGECEAFIAENPTGFFMVKYEERKR